MALTPATLTWTESDSISVASEEDLAEHLSSLQARFERHPTIVELTLADGQSVAAGLGRDWMVLSVNPDVDPPYYVSVGDPNASGSIWFDYFGSPSEFPMTQAVRPEVAIEAMRLFLEDGGLPINIRWQTA